MALTRYRNASTVFTEDAANSMYGGLYGTSRGNALSETDPLVAGHVHDGQHEDGHAQKINLSDHVSGLLNGIRIQSNTITQNKLTANARLGYLATFDTRDDRLSDVEAYDEDDIYRKALQIDTLTEYILTSYSPVVWSPLGGVVEDYIVLGMDNTYPLSTGTTLFTPITVTFPAAPQDLLVKRIVITETNVHENSNLENNNIYCLISAVRINSVAIDTAGYGIAQVFTNYAEIPIDLNIALNETDEIEIDLTFLNYCFADVSLLCIEQPATLPSSYAFLGRTAPGYTAVVASTTKATATITINSVPITGGSITFSNNFFTELTDVVLAAAGGARTSGDNDYDDTLTPASSLATEIAAAINDVANDFDSQLFSASALSNVVTVTSAYAGPIGNFSLITESIPEISISTFSGGSMPSATTITFVAAPENGTLVGLKMISYFGTTVDSSFNKFISVQTLKINGGSNLLTSPISGDILEPTENTNGAYPLLDIAITAGDIITITTLNSYYSNISVAINAIIKY